MVQDVQYLPGLGCSDHLALHFSIVCQNSERSVPGNGFYEDWASADFDEINVRLLACKLEDRIPDLSVEQAWILICEAINEVVKSVIRVKKRRKRKRPYMNKESLSLRRKKERLWNKYCQTRQSADYLNFTRVRNQLRSLTRKLRYDMECRVADSIKGNQKAFWNYVNKSVKVKPAVASLKLSDGSIAYTDKEKCEALSLFFQSVFTKESLDDIPEIRSTQPATRLEDITISLSDVEERLRALKPGKAADIDDIKPLLLKRCAAVLARPLTILFQKSFDTGELPTGWKKALIKAIFKKGDHHSVGNYRPVSLTSVVSKVMESVVKTAIMSHLLDQSLLSDCQYGFLPGKSCESQLLSCMNSWTRHLEEGRPVDIIYTDFRKAFDVVPHRRLLKKLSMYGLGTRIVRWVEGFLCGRTQCVSVNGVTSEWAEVRSGIPQGTVMGPLCFLLYVNDLPEEVKLSSIRLFADDAKIFRSVSTIQERNHLQEDLNRIWAWTEKWQLPLNLRKCSVIHLGTNNQQHDYFLGGTQLSHSASERDLGVQIDAELKFHEHTARVIKKCKSLISIIKRSFCCLDKGMMVKLYKALIRPVAEYGNSVWGPCFKGDQDMLEKLQRRVTKMVAGLALTPYQDRLRTLNLPTLKYRRIRGDLICIYKLVTGKTIADDALLQFHENPHRTRGHSLRLKKVRAQRLVRRQFLTIRACNVWNDLPEIVIRAETTQQFKTRLDKYLKNKRFEI